MDWLNFFFGWLIKDEFEFSVFDEVVFLAEVLIIISIIFIIIGLTDRKKIKK